MEGGREGKAEERKNDVTSTIFNEYLLWTRCDYIGLHSLFFFKKIFSDSERPNSAQYLILSIQFDLIIFLYHMFYHGTSKCLTMLKRNFHLGRKCHHTLNTIYLSSHWKVSLILPNQLIIIMYLFTEVCLVYKNYTDL